MYFKRTKFKKSYHIEVSFINLLLEENELLSLCMIEESLNPVECKTRGKLI